MQAAVAQVGQQMLGPVGLDDSRPERVDQVAECRIGIFERKIVVMAAAEGVPQRVVPDERLAAQFVAHAQRHRCIFGLSHIDAYEYLCNENESNVFNLGNGKGFSVKEVIDMVKKVTGKEFAVKLDERREGDPDILIADATKIKDKLGWTPQYDLETIVESAWNWHKKIYQD